MTNELYFIPILARALRERAPASALREAFKEIKAIDSTEEHAVGFSNFQRFMEEVARHQLPDEFAVLQTQALRELIVELGTDTFEGAGRDREAAMDLFRSLSAWCEEFEIIRAAAGATPAEEPLPALQVKRDDDLVAQIELSPHEPRGSVGGIVPGNYSILLDTGRMLWRDRLEPVDLIWSDAFPGRALDLAADTGERASATSRTERLLEGTLTLRVVPGLERGRIEVELRPGAGG